MSNEKISWLTQWTPVDADWVPFVDISDTTQSASWTTKKALKSELKWDTGTAATADAWTTTTWAAWSNASVVNSWTTSDAIFDFTIPRWDTWAKWDTGDTWATWADWVVQTVVWWTNITVDATDTANPIVNLDSLTTANITEATNKNYVTDAEAVVIWNTSWTNTWDQTSVTWNAWTATALETSKNY